MDADETLVNVNAGLNRLSLQVRDTGGGWSAGARFVDMEGAPVTNYHIRLHPDDVGSGQADSDNDGLGDACDDVDDTIGN